jgi:parallel beta-helix repeat protein
MQSKRTGMAAHLRQMWRKHRLRMGLGLCSAIVLATVLVIPISRSADDEILLYPLPDANYGTLLRVTGSAPSGQTLRIEANHVVVAKTRANESGDFAVAVALPAGAHTIQALADGVNVHPLASAVYPVRQVSPMTNGTSPIAAKTTPTAARGEFTAMAAAAPTIATPPATTTNNPITLSGSAPALAKVGFYVNGRFAREVIAAANGTYSTWVPLEDGLNSIYAVATDNTGASPASNTVQTTYTNSLPRTYGITSITTPTVWTAGSAPTYTLNGALTIAAGATLWIQPGVTVRVSGSYKILANGAFVVRGTSTARSVLRPTQVLCTDTSPRRTTDWPGVETGTASGSVSLEYADIYCATNGVYFNLGTGSLAYTRVLNGGTGVRTLSTAGAATLPPQIVGQNELRGNVNGLYVDAFSSPTVTGNNLITGNTTGISVYGSTVAGTTQNPLPVVNGNSLYANTKNYSATNFVNPATTILNAQGNWWGTADPSAILATIEDRNLGSTTRPYVNYGGFLGAAGGTSAYNGPTLIGPITANTTLAAGSYLMLSDIVVNATRTWTIAPGAEIRAAAGRKILVNGTLQANGTSTQRVRFGSAKPYPAKGDWVGIEVVAGSIANLDYARIEHATNGVYFNAGQGTIAHSLIRFCGTGVYVGAKSNPTIHQGNEISNNTYGIYVRGPTNTSASADNPQPVINGNSLFANTDYNLYTTSFAAPRPTLNATGNWWGTAVPASIAATIFTIGSSSTPVNSSGYLTVEPFLPAITLTGFSMSTQEAKPLVSIQPAAGTFTLNRAGTVTFKIMRDADSVIVRQWSQSFVAGLNAFSWDGRNDLAAIVPGGLYRVLLTATNGLDPYDYDAAVPAGDSAPDCTGCVAPATFNPYLNELVKIKVRYAVPTLGYLRVTPSLGTPFYPINDVYYPAGDHWLYWDGRGPDGALLTVAATLWAGDGKLMRPNGIFVFSPTVAITGLNAAPNIEVRSDPFLVASSYEQASRIVYRVSLDALVRVTILPPGVVDPASPSAIVLVNNVTQPAKDGSGNPIDYTAEWRGYSAADPNAVLAGAEGAYTFAIEATLPATGQKTLYRGILNIVQ